MSWTRLDDNWFVKRQAEGLTLTEIGYFVGLIQYCSRTNTYDGRVKAFYARTIAECDDPDAIIGRLAEAGHVAWDGGHLVLTRIDDYTPPLHMREEYKKPFDRDRKRRQRAHRAGDHSLCSSPACPSAVPCDNLATGPGGEASHTGVACDPGTGQDGPGLGAVPRQRSDATAESNQPASPPPCDLLTGEIADECADCREPLTWCRCTVVHRPNDPT